MTNLYKRSISGFVYVLLFTAAILHSQESYLFLTYFFGLICLREFLKLINFKNVIPYLVFTGIAYVLLFKREYIKGEAYFLIITLSGSLQLLTQLYLKTINFPTSTLGKLDISIRYTVGSLSFLLMLPFLNEVYTSNFILAILLLIWINDSFAFLIGKNFGKRKLFPSVSPKKTIEGFLGGVFFTLLAAYFISNYLSFFIPLQWVVIGAIVSVFGTLGDLVESKFKRQANAKDSGHIMPGHGGLLDRLDSLLFVAPFVYLYSHYLI